MPDHENEHLQKVRAARQGVRTFAGMFEHLLRTTPDPAGRSILIRNLAQADQLLADMDEQIESSKPR